MSKKKEPAKKAAKKPAKKAVKKSAKAAKKSAKVSRSTVKKSAKAKAEQGPAAQAPEGPRFIVGIDLGTTNTTVSYIDKHGLEDSVDRASSAPIQRMPLPQVTLAGDAKALPALPSFGYMPSEHDKIDPKEILPWAVSKGYVLGAYARDRGAQVPGRVVSQAKSWLCHHGVDRMDPLLPQDAPEEVTRISPLEATTRILRYVRRVWDRGFARKDKSLVLAQQDVYLTVPASFDATARMLTLRAADDAGFETVTLLEEPLAAFYAWLAGTGGAWRDRLEVGDAVLVCDVGGGTTDFTIVSARERDGALQLERTAVGHHILLGGDNLDLALARLLQQKLRKEQNVKLDRRRLLGLVHACRGAKEAILAAEGGLDSAGITVQGSGRKLVGGSVTVDLTRADVERVVLEGFLPACELDTEPERADGYGLGEIGLPFERDPRITAHLATFLRGARTDKITHLLFNGGTTRPAAVRQRLADAVQGWFPGDKLTVLDGADLDFAVARGAAFYGLQRSGRGVRVRADIARSYYVGVESPMPAVPGLDPPIKALCLVPRGLEEGTEVTLPGERFQLRIGKPARFRFLTATTRSEDKPGTVLEDWEWEDELQEISPLAVTLPAEADTDSVQVTLHARVTEVGVLELYCREAGGDRTWQLSYNVREAEPEPNGASSASATSDEETAG